METAKELKFGEYKMRKDYIGTLEAIEVGETVILPVDARDYYSIHSAASRCRREKKMKFLLRMNWEEGYVEIERVKWTALDGQPTGTKGRHGSRRGPKACHKPRPQGRKV